MHESAVYNQYLLRLQCPDQLGLMANIANVFSKHNAYINRVSQFGEPNSGIYNSRVEFDDRSGQFDLVTFEAAFAHMAKTLDMQYTLRLPEHRPRVLIAVSKYDHCLNVLLNKWRSGVLNIDIVGVYSNHNDCRDLVSFYQLPYHYLPVDNTNKLAQEKKVLALMTEYQVDLLVLARYMQILSDCMCQQLAGKVINIHHSFLPSFKGARPYQQAHDRGVKLIGATAHYVTADLDEGPIIVQEVKPVDHATSVQDMIEIGHDTESIALARAVRLFAEDRIFLNGERTVIL
ncbi:formyltetrahydrofolate deformylase [Thalassotalea maritima]|uniref:formyltetrahydrofolate deformylase n=1 Tax=Thalassotalea maritima TaxID=3242416 RepID=UPI003529AA0D